MKGKLALATLMFGALALWPALSQQAPTGVPPTPPPAASAPASPMAPVETPPAQPQLTAADVSAWLDGYFPGVLKQGKIAGAEVVIVKDGQIIAKKGYGYADVGAKKPMDPDRTLVRIGSTSKLFTWTAVMQLVEQGKLDLNADVNRYLDFKITPPSGRAITMNDLMTHRGGFEEGLKDVLATDPKLLKTNEAYLKENQRPILFPAGTVPAYSNYGTSLAGYIVERVSGQKYDDYIEQHILAPLGMRHTSARLPLPTALVPDMSKGYMRSDQAPRPFELITTAPAGSVSATGADMANFMIAQLQGGRFGDAQILRPETAALMQRPEGAQRPGFDAMAHGYFWGRRNGQLVIGHGGDTVVFHTDMNLLPERNVGFFVSFNSRGENDSVYGARDRLFDLFMDRYFPAPTPKDPPAIATAAADAAKLAGRYESSRRIETGFLALFYLLQQDQVVANPDGTISLSSIEGKTFREIAPNLWRELGGTQQLFVSEINGRLTIQNSTDPTSVLHATPALRSASLNTPLFGLSLLVLLATLIAWPIGAWLRRRYQQPATLTGRPKLAARLTRIAAGLDLAYLGGWFLVLKPIFSMDLDAFNSGLDGMIRLLQVAALIPIAGVVVSLWNLWLTVRSDRGIAAKARSIIVAVAFLSILWFAWMGSLIGFSVNY